METEELTGETLDVATLRNKISQLKNRQVEMQNRKKYLRELWFTYKYHNCSEDWYLDVIYRAGGNIKDASRTQDYLGDSYQDALFTGRLNILDRPQQGIEIYARLEHARQEAKSISKEISDTIMDLWESDTPLKTIAEIYGATENTTYIYISRQDRFKKRKQTGTETGNDANV